MAFLNWFNQGGIFMYLILFADALTVAVIIALLIIYTPARFKPFLISIVAVSLLPLLVGAFGNLVGYEQAMSVLPMVDPAQKQRLYEESMVVARIPSIFGGISTAALWFIGIVGLKLR